MTITRRTLLAVAAAAPALVTRARASDDEHEPAVDDDRLYTQDWFHTSFLDMSEDLAEAASQGKHLMILWEQRGCPYCRELHRINFRRDDIVSYLKEHYVVLQLNLWGDREATDFDGEVLSEKQIAKKWHVNFTPTVILVNGRDAGAKSMREAEAFRMPGYFKPFHFLAGLEFAAGDTYRDQHFQRFVQEKADHLREQGQPVTLWD